MKKFKINIAVFTVCLFYLSCSKLEEHPQSFITQNAYYTNEKQAVAGVNGIYSILTSPGCYGYFYRLAELPTDQGETGGLFQPSEPTTSSLNNFTFNSSNSTFEDFWQDHYIGINDANLAIAKIPGISMDATEQKRLIAEARFLRALLYFNLVRLFGDVPMPTTYTNSTENLDLARTSTTEVYKLIESDLTSAIPDLPTSYSATDIGRATKGAALTLLGKVYLTLKDWQDAKSTLKSVIDLNQYSLFPNYSDLWQLSNKNGQEFIFSVQYQAGVINSAYSTEFAPRSSGIQAGQSYGEVAPTPTFLKLYASNDTRLSFFKDSYPKYQSSVIVNFGHPFCFKYFDLDEGGNSGQNYPVLRFADVLLMYAEAENEIDGVGDGSMYSSIWGLNQIRVRAGQPAKTSTDFTQSSLRNEIWDERSRELCFEGHRWFDLVRTNTLIQAAAAAGKTATQKNLVCPIPQPEINADKNLVQNPGY